MVYVLDQNKEPLMPTIRYGNVRRMLRDGLAKVVNTKPFTVQLCYEPETTKVQRVFVGQDPGRTNIGLSAIRGDGKELYSAVCHTRNKEIPKLMQERKVHRQQSRRGERLARKRLAKRLGTTTKRILDRILPGYEEPVKVKDIINTEARFNNRKRPEEWLTPTARQLLETHIHLMEQVCRILPVSDVVLEVNKFAFMAMDHPGVKRLDYKSGPLKGFGSVKEAVFAMQDGRCMLCGGEITQYHHIVPRAKGGSNTIANLAGLCDHCHEFVHKEEKSATRLESKKAGLNKKYRALSILNQIIPYLVEEYETMFPDHIYLTNGWDTKKFREDHHVKKTHNADAYCIAASALPDGAVIRQDLEPYEILQFRRHDRAIIHSQRERTYYLDGEKVAVNRKKRMDQKYDSLEYWYQKMRMEHGPEEADVLRSQLTVKKSQRHYNNLNRVLPGAVFLHEGKRYVMTGQISHGMYYRAYVEGSRNFPAAKCKILQTSSLVYA